MITDAVVSEVESMKHRSLQAEPNYLCKSVLICGDKHLMSVYWAVERMVVARTALA
jgi:hypothetical protein